MDNIDQIIRNIDEILVMLASPVSNQEMADGWTEHSKCEWKKFFEDLKTKLLSNEQLRSLNIPRGLDYWGICRGEISAKAAKISIQLSELNV